MAEIISFDGQRKVSRVQALRRQPAGRTVENMHTEPRLVRRFVLGNSIETIAQAEHLTRLRVQQAIRERLLTTDPDILRRAA